MPTLILINLKKTSLSTGKLKNTNKLEQKQSHEMKPGIIELEKTKISGNNIW